MCLGPLGLISSWGVRGVLFTIREEGWGIELKAVAVWNSGGLNSSGEVLQCGEL